jgi:predicted phosphohydrolase
MWPDRPVITVPGNHEYYGKSWPAHTADLRASAAEYPNVHFLENNAMEIEGVVFLGCTLWTDCKLWEAGTHAGLYDYPEVVRDIQTGMMDYRSIRFAGPGGKCRSLKPSDVIKSHLDSVRWLKEQFKVHRGKRIVVTTHHSPSYKSIPETYSQDIISAAFASHLDELVESSGAALWVHGHNHSATDYMIGKTRVICNPKGYPDEAGNGFEPSLTVKV